MLALNKEEYSEKLINYIKNNLIYLSKQKYSSNVIDKSILKENGRYLNVILDKLLETKASGDLILDQYGNYGKQLKI